MAVRRDHDRHTLDDFESIPLEPLDLAGVVRHEADLADAEVDEDLRAFAIVAEIWREAERDVRLDRVQTLLLKMVRVKLVRESDAATFLAHIDDGAAALLFDHLHRRVQLGTAVAALGAQHVAREALGVDAHKNGFLIPSFKLLVDVALHQGEMLKPGQPAPVHRQLERSMIRRQVHRLDLLDQRMIRTLSARLLRLRLAARAAKRDEIGNRHELERMAPSEGANVIHARHRAVILHDLAAETDLLEAGEATEVDRGLGVSRPLEDAAFAGLEREHVPGTAEVLRLRPVLHRREGRHRAFRGGDARCRVDAVN